MNTTTEKALAAVPGVVLAMLMPVSTAMADNTPMGGGTMNHEGTYGHMYGLNSAWLIALVVVVLGVVLFAVLRKSR